jgi:hypothetical protein
VAVALLLALIAVAVLRARRRALVVPPSVAERDLPDPLIRLPWRQALLAALAVGVVCGFVFALRAGAVLLPLTVLALRVGVSVRRLTAAAIAGIALLVPIYLVFQPKDRGGFNFGYAVDLLGAHWIAVGIVCCIAAASLLTTRGLRAAAPPSDLLGPDHAVPRDQLAQDRDAHDERQPRPVARLDAQDP